MTYKIEINAKDLEYIGGLLEKQPYGEVAKLVAGIQAQIDAQEEVTKKERAAAFEKARQDWVESEIERRKQAEAPEATESPPEQGD